MSNGDHFSTVAREYANFRPGYPPALFAWLAGISPAHQAVWDCGCGSGQASTALAEHFEVVWATDVAAEQIAAARAHPRVNYAIAPAEHSGLADASVDLVTVAQALHWFELDAFYAEARRVARRGALLAAWTYPRPEFVEAAPDAVFFEFYSKVVGPHWPAERRHVETQYRELPFPPGEIAPPAFALELDWKFDQVIGYASSWSAAARYRRERGEDPLPWLRDRLRAVWPEDVASRPLRMRLALRVAPLHAPATRPARAIVPSARSDP